MTELSKRFEQIVKSTQKRLYEQGALLPVKVDDGILVGSAKIVCEGLFKNIWVDGDLKYKQISLNESAIKIANVLACNKPISKANEIFDLDQQYSKHFADCAFYLDKYHKACQAEDAFRSDLYWIRYQEANYMVKYCKDRISRISTF
jgi:hypothetical protein